MPYEFDAYVTAALFSKSSQGIFALGDGTVRFATGEVVEAHDGAILCACLHPSGEGVITGGDDGRLVWSQTSGPQEIAEIKGRWIDAVAASPDSGLIAFAAGKDVHVRDVADPDFARTFAHESSALGLAFDPKGRRLAVAAYGGARLWFARIAEQKPMVLAWAGSHIALAWSPDGKFLMSSMQENQLHGWRVADEKNMRMGGYPAKVKSLVFMSKGQFLATSGAQGVVIWPFGGSAGPMGKEAAEVGYDASTLVAQVAGTPTGRRVAAGLEDGRVWVCDLEGQKIEMLKAEKGAAITALAISADGKRVAWGDEDGAAGIAEAP
ncbi:MAG: WD40 repeat protein [Pseudoalteromonas distincta]|jgi:WD40 repeat protein